jgi:ribosome recycling factor
MNEKENTITAEGFVRAMEHLPKNVLAVAPEDSKIIVKVEEGAANGVITLVPEDHASTLPPPPPNRQEARRMVQRHLKALKKRTKAPALPVRDARKKR